MSAARAAAMSEFASSPRTVWHQMLPLQWQVWRAVTVVVQVMNHDNMLACHAHGMHMPCQHEHVAVFWPDLDHGCWYGSCRWQRVHSQQDGLQRGCCNFQQRPKKPLNVWFNQYQVDMRDALKGAGWQPLLYTSN
jgi:hypothetical protein